MDDDELQDQIAEDRWQRQRHARHMALPPGHPDEPEDEGDSDDQDTD
jgi:hypothetical protein